MKLSQNTYVMVLHIFVEFVFISYRNVVSIASKGLRRIVSINQHKIIMLAYILFFFELSYSPRAILYSLEVKGTLFFLEIFLLRY